MKELSKIKKALKENNIKYDGIRIIEIKWITFQKVYEIMQVENEQVYLGHIFLRAYNKHNYLENIKYNAYDKDIQKQVKELVFI